MTADDQFAGTIPECPMDGVGSLTCNNEDVPPSPDCSRSPSPADTHCLEGKDKTCVSQPVFKRDGGEGWWDLVRVSWRTSRVGGQAVARDGCREEGGDNPHQPIPPAHIPKLSLKVVNQ